MMHQFPSKFIVGEIAVTPDTGGIKAGTRWVVESFRLEVSKDRTGQAQSNIWYDCVREDGAQKRTLHQNHLITPAEWDLMRSTKSVTAP